MREPAPIPTAPVTWKTKSELGSPRPSKVKTPLAAILRAPESKYAPGNSVSPFISPEIRALLGSAIISLYADLSMASKYVELVDSCPDGFSIALMPLMPFIVEDVSVIDWASVE
jgi:hypothetical protein